MGQSSQKILVLDDACRLCSEFAGFVKKQIKPQFVQIVWLNSPKGQHLNRAHSGGDTLIFVENGVTYLRSTAFLQVARYFKFPYSLLRIIRICPPVIRDWVYDQVSANRYRLLGKTQLCNWQDDQSEKISA